jgi:hypothetical protein
VESEHKRVPLVNKPESEHERVPPVNKPESEHKRVPPVNKPESEHEGVPPVNKPLFLFFGQWDLDPVVPATDVEGCGNRLAYCG